MQYECAPVKTLLMKSVPSSLKKQKAAGVNLNNSRNNTVRKSE